MVEKTSLSQSSNKASLVPNKASLPYPSNGTERGCLNYASVIKKINTSDRLSIISYWKFYKHT